jgi:hypothetical protein
MITVWNYRATPQDMVLTLYYSGGHYAIPIHLAARQSYNLDMMSLVRSRVPDPSGTLIPSNITSGSGILSGAGGETDKISVAIAASVFNVRNATCGGTCTTCNGTTEFTMDPESYAMPVAGTQAAQARVTWNTGSVYTNPSGTTWSTASSSIASVSSSGTLTGRAPGETGVSALLSESPVFSENCTGDMEGGCPSGNLGCGEPAEVQVPTASRIVSTVSNAAKTDCPSGQAGWDRIVTKIVTDQETPPQDIVAGDQGLTETYTVSPNPFGITTVQTATTSTNSDGVFGDHFFICSTLCPSNTGQINASQSITDVYNGSPYTLTPNAIVYSCKSITVNGN